MSVFFNINGKLMKAILFICLLFGGIYNCYGNMFVLSSEDSLLKYVDPFVGTGSNKNSLSEGDAELGQTIPAVLIPNGMNFWTPQTESTEQKSQSPYYYTSSKLQGFRNSHWIVGGCTQDYGSMTLMPLMDSLQCIPEKWASRFSHDTEIASPYYYSVLLDDYEIKAEMTGTSRTAIFRFTYRQSGMAYLVVTPNSDEGQGSIYFNPSNGEVYGMNPVHRIYQGWGEYAGFDGHFSVVFNKKIETYGTFADGYCFENTTSQNHRKTIGVYVGFPVKAGEEILVKVASSFCDVAGARHNLQVENPDWNFEAVKEGLKGIWEKRLSAIRVETSDSIAKSKFYTSLYHASFLPHALNDADGRYPSFAGGGKICTTAGTYFDDYSLWDTYRALHPLLSILYPQQTGDMIQSLIDKYEQGGWLPIFPCWNSYTSEMIGDHCASLIADAYQKGIRNFDVQKAYEALRKNAFEHPETYEEYKDDKGRRALKSYLKYGYIPLEDSVKEAFHHGEQVSRTLEYAYDDFTLSVLASSLGQTEDAEELRRRSQFYRNVIDRQTGYAQGRYADGSFLKENNAFQFCDFITEGYPSHYTWYVPHDVYGLMECMGGKDKFVSKLDSMFSMGYYWHGNEPCHQVAFLYNYAGQPWKTQKEVRQIMEHEYHLGANGLSGNDDAGQMSAWYIFAAMGFYPVCPGSSYYILASPSFDKVTIQLEDGKSFVIKAQDASADNVYVQSVLFNGVPYSKNYLLHSDIAAGGELEFVMGNEPNLEWGSSLDDCPPDLFLELR